MNERPGILIVDADRVLAEALQKQLAGHGYCVRHVTNGEAAIEALHQQRANQNDGQLGVVLIDHDATGTASGPALIRCLHDDWPTVVPIVTSAFRKIESAVQAMRLGAADYLLKPIIEAELLDAVRRAEQRHLLFAEHELAQEEVGRPLGDEHAERADRQADGWKPMPLSEAMKGPERGILLSALEANGWNRGETAKQLDINRTTLYKKIRQHRLDEPA